MRHFLFEDKEYRINPRFKRRRNEQDSAQALARLLRKVGRGKRRGGGSSGRYGGGNRYGPGRRVDARQKCMVKMQYSNSIDAHHVQLEQYLVREGTDREGSRANLYGTDLDEYRAHMTDRNFRIFLSPQSEKVDLKAMTEQFIIKLEAATGYRLYWQAANHYNTAHQHAHILIKGTDQNGKEVKIPRDIVTTFMREYARDICTEQLGYRTSREMEIEKEKELEAQRYTRLDDKISALCDGSLRVNLSAYNHNRERIVARLENLRKMNLCIYKDGAYKLSPTWDEDLRANARYNAYLKSRDMLEHTDPSNLKLYSGGMGTITGKVTKVFRTEDDASDNHAVIIEGLDGNAYFVPLFKKPVMYERTGKMNVKEGDPANKKQDSSVKTKLKAGEMVELKPVGNQQGRLTPLFFKRDISQIRREIQKNGYTSDLAAAVLSGKIHTTKIVTGMN